MQGHPDVIDYLNTLLTGELAARDQYFIHSRMYEDWGFSKLYERINHEMEEEAQHADALMRRILTLSVEQFGSDGKPSSVRLEFTEQLGLNGRTVTTYKAAAYDSDGDHVLDTFSDIDVDKNGIADEVDRSLIDELSRGFLKFNWYQAPAACGH